jgi:hypothetical protein
MTLKSGLSPTQVVEVFINPKGTFQQKKYKLIPFFTFHFIAKSAEAHKPFCLGYYYWLIKIIAIIYEHPRMLYKALI